MPASIVPHRTHSVLEPIPTNSLPSTAQTPPRPRPAHGTENVPVQPPPTPWDEDSEEGRALHHFGIEDSDAELEKEEFDSIPGYDDFSLEEDEPGEPRSVYLTRKAPALSDTDVPVWSIDAGDADANSVDGKVHGGSTDDESSCSSDSELDSDSDSDADTDSSVDSRHSSSAKDSDSDPPAHNFAGIAEEYNAYEACDDVGSDASDGSEYHGSVMGPCSQNTQASVNVSDGGDNGLQQQALNAEGEEVSEYSALPCVRPLRRSTRLQAATKRRREESPDSEDFESSSRPAKRRNLRVSKGGASVDKQQDNGQRRRKPATNPSVTLGRPSARLHSPKPPAEQPPAQQQRSARSGRIPQAFLKNCIVSEKPEVACGIKPCNGKKKLVVKEPHAARQHIKSHYDADVLKDSARIIKCLWSGCGQSVKVGGHADGLMRHYNEAHLGLRYGCPGKCTDKHGNRRVWSRSDELTRHEQRDPCEYLLHNPLPRGKP